MCIHCPLPLLCLHSITHVTGLIFFLYVLELLHEDVSIPLVRICFLPTDGEKVILFSSRLLK